MSFVSFTDILTGRAVGRTADDTRYILGPQMGEVTLFEPAEPCFAFPRHDESDTLFRPVGLLPDYEGVVAEATQKGMVGALTHALFDHYLNLLDRRGTLTWGEAAGEIGNARLVGYYAQQFGITEETTFYVSRAAALAWQRLKQHLAR